MTTKRIRRSYVLREVISHAELRKISPEFADSVARDNFVRNTLPRCVHQIYPRLSSQRMCARVTMDWARKMGLDEAQVRSLLSEDDGDEIFGRPRRGKKPALAGLLS